LQPIWKPACKEVGLRARRRDDLEAREVDELLTIHREVLAINKTQLTILHALHDRRNPE